MMNQDERRVVLIKSVATKNRFYTLIQPDRGIRNADTVEQIPGDLILGIAYPCLEDGLNDFAVIRTTFETLDLFPEDDPVRDEMMEIINDARGNLIRRLMELRDKIAGNQAHFLGTDYDEFRKYVLDMVTRGCTRRNLDSMMKLNVFSSVAQAEGHADSNELLYYFEFTYVKAGDLTEKTAREFLVNLFDEVLASVLADTNYGSKYLFDRNVFQKFIAVMFVNYATTDPMFYGINRADYGVSGEKDMDSTPLYLAIRKELTEIEHRIFKESSFAHIPLPTQTQEPDFSFAAPLPSGAVPEPTPSLSDFTHEQASSLLPGHLVNEEVLLGPISSLCAAASLLLRKNDPDAQRYARVILADASKLVDELKRLGIIPPEANDPCACG